ncbi:hypothetical protein Sa4125_37400 [Aureimonas sp. SA4125]|nr:hypothetical protein Sa4125_37400 [Aureimonas sp. SA4125]
MTHRTAWHCPHCAMWHSPHVDTCPEGSLASQLQPDEIAPRPHLQTKREYKPQPSRAARRGLYDALGRN